MGCDGGVYSFVYNKCENWKTGCYRCPRCGNSDTGGELKGVFRTMPWVLRKKEAYITSVPNLTFVTVSEWLSGVVRSSVVGSVPVQVIFQRSGLYSILSSYRYTSH